jgi:hypothetical protein
MSKSRLSLVGGGSIEVTTAGLATEGSVGKADADDK